MNSNILICGPVLIAIVILAGLYFRTFGLSRPGPAATAVIDGTADASGRTLRQRLDQSTISKG